MCALLLFVTCNMHTVNEKKTISLQMQISESKLCHPKVLQERDNLTTKDTVH